jgi:hypothetical protein
MNLIVLYFQGSAQTQGVMTRASAGNAMQSSGTYQLVMDPRLGLIVGTVTSPQATPGVFRKRGVSVRLFLHIPYFFSFLGNLLHLSLQTGLMLLLVNQERLRTKVKMEVTKCY